MSAERWYRLLLRVYPAWFRRRYGEEMVNAFLRLYRDGGERIGGRSRMRVLI